MSIFSGYDLSYFRNGDTLNKQYIIERMAENIVYNEYIPNEINLKKLSYKFLLSVSIYFI